MKTNFKKPAKVFALILALILMISGCAKTKPYENGHLGILPTLNLIGETDGLVTKRDCVLNYPLMGEYVGVTDRWTLKNTTGSDITITAAMTDAPFQRSELYVDGNSERTVNYLARFRGSALENAGYKAKLASGAYLKSALEPLPTLDDGAIVYDFSGLLNEDGRPVSGTDITIRFKYDSSKTRVYVNNGRYSEEQIQPDDNQISATLPIKEDETITSRTIMLIVTGEDIFDCEVSESGKDSKPVSDLNVNRYEATVSEALYDLSKAVYTRYADHRYDIDSDEAQYEERSFSEWYKIVCKGFEEYSKLGVLPANAKSENEREPFYDLGILMSEPEYALSFKSVKLTVPANGERSIEISGILYNKALLFTKVNSDEYACNCEEFNVILDIPTDALNFVTLDNNMGLNIKKGVTEAALDADSENYYFAFEM